MADTVKKLGRTSAAEVLGDGIAVIDLEIGRMLRAVRQNIPLERDDARLLSEYTRTLGNVAAAERKAMEDGVGALSDDELETLADSITKALKGRRKAG